MVKVRAWYSDSADGVASGPAKAKTAAAAPVHTINGQCSFDATKHITKVIPRIIIPELKLFIATITASGIARVLFMIYRFMLIASNAPDLFGALIVVGIMAHISIQVILNIAVVTNSHIVLRLRQKSELLHALAKAFSK